MWASNWGICNLATAFPLKHLHNSLTARYMARMKTLTPEFVAAIENAAENNGAALDQALHTADGRNLAAVLLGRRGGLKGGRARAESLSPERRREIARAAANARWSKK